MSILTPPEPKPDLAEVLAYAERQHQSVRLIVETGNGNAMAQARHLVFAHVAGTEAVATALYEAADAITTNAAQREGVNEHPVGLEVPDYADTLAVCLRDLRRELDSARAQGLREALSREAAAVESALGAILVRVVMDKVGR